jgi:DNA-binding HxlR family transcriptional regulator
MKRSSFEAMNCSLARSLEVFGEWWSLLIIREAMWGTSRFDDFHTRLGIARNILVTRLEKLEQEDVIERRQSPENARIYDYVLTGKGWDLFPVVVAIMQWGDRWIHNDSGPPIQFFDQASGLEIKTMDLQNQKGKSLQPSQIDIRPGPGADKATQKRADAVKRPKRSSI